MFAYKLYIRTILKGRHYIVNFTLKLLEIHLLVDLAQNYPSVMDRVVFD